MENENEKVTCYCGHVGHNCCNDANGRSPSQQRQRRFLVLQMAIATRIENMMADPSDWCGQIKQEATDENWFMCLAPAIITYNRLRGLPDNERAPFHVREAITKGCIMIIFNVNEAKAAAVAKRNVEK
jgi:hypothetical protein